MKKTDNQVVPSGVEPLSLGPGPKRIATTPRDYTLTLSKLIYKFTFKKKIKRKLNQVFLFFEMPFQFPHSDSFPHMLF